LRTTKTVPIEVRILRLFTFEVGGDTFGNALPYYMPVRAVQRTISEIIGRPAERLATQADRPLEQSRTMGTIASQWLRVMFFTRQVHVRHLDHQPMAASLYDSCLCSQLMQECPDRFRADLIICTADRVIATDNPVPDAPYSLRFSQERCLREWDFQMIPGQGGGLFRSRLRLAT
jgi:hypothetical protein